MLVAMTRRTSTALSLLPLATTLLIGCANAQSLDAQNAQLKAAIAAAERGQQCETEFSHRPLCWSP
ncbi:hypothetical protein C7E12_20255 [Stenotrophomonas maltophilia]|nr:hypothetical protein C7E12_20255 [Stenotrophomonas maltophilia]